MSVVRQRWQLTLAGAIAIATAAGYATIILGQETSSLTEPVPVFVIGYLAVLAAAAGVGVLHPGRSASAGASAATGGLFAMGVLGLFSIGLPLLIAAVFAAWGLVRTRGTASNAAWLDACVGLLAAAFALVLLVLP